MSPLRSEFERIVESGLMSVTNSCMKYRSVTYSDLTHGFSRAKPSSDSDRYRMLNSKYSGIPEVPNPVKRHFFNAGSALYFSTSQLYSSLWYRRRSSGEGTSTHSTVLRDRNKWSLLVFLTTDMSSFVPAIHG